MQKEKTTPTIKALILALVIGVMKLSCVLVGLGFIGFGFFMTPEYAGEQHNLQIIGMLLLLLGGTS